MALKVWLPLNKDTRNVGLNNVNVTNNGVTLTTGGIYGNCCLFNGSSYLTFSTPVSLSSTGHSICCWLDLTNINSTQYFLGFGMGGIRYGSDNSFLYYYNGQTLTWTYTKVNRFVHIAFVCNSNSVKLYVDGTQIGDAKSLSNGTNTCTLVGKRNDGYYYNGKMNDLRIYDHAINEDDIKRIRQKKELDIVPYSGIKNILFDRSGLMIGNLVPYNITYRPMCAYFNGSTSAIQIPPMTSMNDSGIFSMNVWFYKDGFGSKNWETIFGGPSGFELEMKPRTENTPRIVAYNWGQSSATGITYATKQWNMLTMTRTTSNSKFYLNVELKYTGKAASIPSGDYWVGSWKVYNSQNYKGLVSNFKLYRKELTAEEILKLYNTECNMFLPDEYEELEYIQSNGNQYIDTGIKGETRWVGCAQSVTSTTKSQTILITNGGGTVGTFIGSVGNGNKWTVKGSPYSTNYDITSKRYFDVLFKTTGPSGYIDDINISISTSCTLTSNWMISCERTTLYPYIGKIYYLKAYQNNVLVRNFIPAKRKSDNVIGLYDMVSRQFFTNSGTGSFTGA